MRRSRIAAAALVVLASSLAGCSAFRAQAGLGLGLGANARVGVVDVGAMIGGSYEWGTVYGVPGGAKSGEAAFPLVGRLEVLNNDKERIDRDRYEGLIPALLYLGDINKERDPYRLNRPTEVAISLRLGFISLHLGFDPAAAFRAIAGWDEPEPPTEPERESEHERRRGYRAHEPDMGPDAMDALGDDPTALIRIRSGDATVSVAPGIALVLSEQDASPEWALVVKRQEARGAARFKEGVKFADPSVLAPVLADCPLAPQAPHAARVLGEVLFERGDLAGATEAFELETRLGGGAPEALARAALARRLATSAGGTTVESSSESPRRLTLGSLRLASHALGVTATTAKGEIAWTHSASFAPTHRFIPPNFPISFTGARQLALVGACDGLAFVTLGDQLPTTIVALDEKGECRWRAPLPSLVAHGSGQRSTVVVARGRILVVRRDRAFALSAATGRLEWLFARRERRMPGSIPMECGPVLRSKLDGPVVKVGLDTVEWKTDGFARWHSIARERIERLDIRTGLPVPGPR